MLVCAPDDMRETAGKCILWTAPGALRGISDNAIDLALQHMLYILAPGQLGIGRRKAMLAFALADERTCLSKCITQIRCMAQGRVEEGVAEIGPIVSIFAAERCMIGVCRSDHQRVGIGKRADENSGI